MNNPNQYLKTAYDLNTDENSLKNELIKSVSGNLHDFS